MIKKLLLFFILISITLPLADAIPLSDKTGLKFTFPVKIDNHSFLVEATGNLDITNFDFDEEKKYNQWLAQQITFKQMLTQNRIDNKSLKLVKNVE